MNTRTAAKVSSPAFSFTSFSFVSFWSGQLIVPASLSPSFLIVRVDIRFWPPISYSHFHVPIGFAFSPRPRKAAEPEHQRRREDRLHVCLQNVASVEPSDADHLPPLNAIVGMPRAAVRWAWRSAFLRAHQYAHERRDWKAAEPGKESMPRRLPQPAPWQGQPVARPYVFGAAGRTSDNRNNRTSQDLRYIVASRLIKLAKCP